MLGTATLQIQMSKLHSRLSHINELHFLHSSQRFSLYSLCVCGVGLALCLLVPDIHSSWFEGEVLGLREGGRIFEWEVEKECVIVLWVQE